MSFTIKTVFPIAGNTVIELNDMPTISLGQFVTIDDIKAKVVGIPMLPSGKYAIEVDKTINVGQKLYL